MSLSTRRGFTLVEMLVVFGIVAMTGALLFPVFQRAKVSSKVTSSISNLKQLHMATKLYVSDNCESTLYGSYDAMGLPVPRRIAIGLRPYGFADALVDSPCGCHQFNTACPSAWNVEAAWLLLWWAELSPQYEDNTPLWFDVNCNDAGTRLGNLWMARRGNAVLLSGTAISKFGTGNLNHPSFYAQPKTF